MAVTKRTRFEVLRRDGHTCQYCGLKATQTEKGLTVDHVVPVALGGADGPENLVAACRDCNAGKSSIQPDSPLVKSLGASAQTYALAMMQRMAEVADAIDRDNQFIEYFLDVWESYTDVMGRTNPLPEDHKNTLRRWNRMGIRTELTDYAIDVAMTNKNVHKYDKFRYTAGVIYRTLDEHELDLNVDVSAVRVFTFNDLQDAQRKAFQEGAASGAAKRNLPDLVARHIDGGGYA